MADTGEYKLRLVVESMVGNAIKEFTQAKTGANALNIASGNLMRTLGKTAVKFGSLATAVTVTTKVIKASTNASIEFNTALANVATLIPQEEQRLLSLKGTIEGLSIDSGKSLDDLTDGVYQVISAFGDAIDTEQKLTIVTKSAIAGQSSTTESLNLLSAVTKAYGDTSASALSQVSDLAFLTVKLGQTTYPELATSIQKVTSLSELLDVSQQELFTTFATLTGVTGDAAVVSTQFKAVLNALLSPTDSLNSLMQELGVTSGQAMIQEYGFQGSLKEIIKYSEKLHVPLSDLVSSQEAIVAVQALGSAQADVFNAKLEQMNKSAGTTNKAFNEVSDGINDAGFALKQLKSMVKVVATQIGDKFTPSVSFLAKGLTNLIGRVTGNVTAQTQMKKSYEELISLSSDYVKINDELSESIDDQTTAYLNLQKALLEDKIQDALTDLSKNYEGTNEKIGELEQTLTDSQSVVDKNSKVFKKLGKMLGITVDSTLDWQQAMIDTNTATEDNLKNNMRLSDALAKLGYSDPAFITMVLDYNKALGKVDSTTSDLNVATAEQQYQMQLIAQAVADETTNIDSLASKNKALYDTIMDMVDDIKADDLAKSNADSTKTITEQMEAYKDFSIEELNAEISSLKYAEKHEISQENRKTLTELINALLEKRNGLQKTQDQLAESYKKTMTEQYQQELATLTAGEGLVKIENDRANAIAEAKANHADDANMLTTINALYDEQAKQFNKTIEAQLDSELASQKVLTAEEEVEQARKQAIKTLEEQGVTEQSIFDKTNALYDNKINAIRSSEQELENEEDAVWALKIATLEAGTEAESLEIEKQNAIAEAIEKYGEESKVIESITEYYDKLKKAKEDAKDSENTSYLEDLEDWGKGIVSDDTYAELDKLQSKMSKVENTWNQMSSITNAVSDAFSSYHDKVMSDMEAELSKTETDAETKRETADKVLEDLKDDNDTKISNLQDMYENDAISYDEYISRKKEIDNEYQNAQNKAEAEAIKSENAVLKAQYEIDKSSFESNKKTSIANAIISGAEGTMKSWAMGPIVGAAMSTVIAGATAYNVSQIASQSGPTEPTYAPVPTYFEEGGVVNSATNAIIGEAGPEAVIPLDKFDQTVFGSKTSSKNSVNYNITGNTFVGVGGVDDLIVKMEERRNVLKKRNRI